MRERILQKDKSVEFPNRHKSSAQNIIPKYSKDSNIVNKEGGKTLAEFPNSIELGKLGPGQDPNNKEHSTTSLVVFFLLVAMRTGVYL
ncbi:maturase K [Trifolium repens]|nr:maturase K [Trifolium repens]